MLEAANGANGVTGRVVSCCAKNFAWGTSSRSSKMVHGGIRYMAQGDFRLVREFMSASGCSRVTRIGGAPAVFIRGACKAVPSCWAMKPIMWLYDRFAGIRDHQWWSISRLTQRVPQLMQRNSRVRMYYTDALVDDARWCCAGRCTKRCWKAGKCATTCGHREYSRTMWAV